MVGTIIASMEDFDARLAEVLQSRPGLTKERLAAAMNREPDTEFRTSLDGACDKGLAHKVQDKYYPGSRVNY